MSLKHGVMVSPYTALAAIYDKVMGNAAAPMICRAFEHNCARFGIDFRSLADIGCGTGLFLRFVAEPGRRLIGVDKSQAMLLRARRRLRGTGALLLQQELRQMRLPHRIELVTCNFDTLNYFLKSTELIHIFNLVNNYLINGGHMIFDMITGSGFPKCRHSMCQLVRLPRVTARWTVTLDGHRGRSIVGILIDATSGESTSQRFAERHVQRWYPVAQVRQLLDRAGFRLLGCLALSTRRPATERDFWIQYVAQKC